MIGFEYVSWGKSKEKQKTSAESRQRSKRAYCYGSAVGRQKSEVIAVGSEGREERSLFLFGHGGGSREHGERSELA